MDIVVKGRNVEVPEHYRVHVTEKLSRLERYDRREFHFDVELFHEPNRRQSKSCQRVEITCRSRGPAVRAEACAGDFYGALDAAASKLENRLRRMHDRRRVHHGRHCPEPTSVAAAEHLPRVVPQIAQIDGNTNGQLAATRTAVLDVPEEAPATTPGIPEQAARYFEDDAVGHKPGRIVREKEHPAKPMTVDQALYEMELVGHDFYLFSDVDSGRPSVVYRRQGFDYGVITLT
ncbi:MAG: ribosome hibernation-promoting factor, HPF/YfiA family [Sciscionella sp.]